MSYFQIYCTFIGICVYTGPDAGWLVSIFGSRGINGHHNTQHTAIQHKDTQHKNI
jgi:hypothetical protein